MMKEIGKLAIIRHSPRMYVLIVSSMRRPLRLI